MQAISRNTPHVLEPRVYRNRPSPPQLVSDRSGDELDTIYVVDADPEVRATISACLSASANVVECASAADYVGLKGTAAASCVILSISLPDISGLDLQRRIIENGNPPVIFIGDHVDIASTVRAIKDGALDFHPKPVDLMALCASVRTALAQIRKTRQRRADLNQLQERFKRLTPREREVLPLVVGGLLNKQAASCGRLFAALRVGADAPRQPADSGKVDRESGCGFRKGATKRGNRRPSILEGFCVSTY
jgi:FixJ family two-component response regulator